MLDDDLPVVPDPVPVAYDPDVSHGYLVAVLSALGGSVEVDASCFDPEALGTPDGRLHGVAMGPGSTPGSVRLAVTPNPHRNQ